MPSGRPVSRISRSADRSISAAAQAGGGARALVDVATHVLVGDGAGFAVVARVPLEVGPQAGLLEGREAHVGVQVEGAALDAGLGRGLALVDGDEDGGFGEEAGEG